MSDLHKEMNNIVKAVDDLNLEDWVLSQPYRKSYIFFNDSNFNHIKNHPAVLQDCHSSASFAKAFKHTHLFYFRL
tara:strand:+ start:353 stop:577 length:225 start_codon:yes stop_codon:yes gene_type:complete